jgi:hypothetical protein
VKFTENILKEKPSGGCREATLNKLFIKKFRTAGRKTAQAEIVTYLH